VSRCKFCSKDKPWTCPKCNVKNLFYKPKCGNCSTPKPNLTGWICGKCGIYNFKTLKFCTMCEQRHNHISNKFKYDVPVPIEKQTKTMEKKNPKTIPVNIEEQIKIVEIKIEKVQNNSKEIAQRENIKKDYEMKLRKLENKYEHESNILKNKFEKEKKILKSEYEKNLEYE
jgi:hypothetical protein